MTYIAAWKTRDTVYIVGDTATTVLGPNTAMRQKLGHESTTFSERNYDENGVLVYEGTLKIINVGKLVLAFSGNIATANEAIASVNSQVSAGTLPLDALTRTLNSFTPLSKRNEFALVAAFPSADGPVLFAFNEQGDQKSEVLSEGYLVQLGTLPELQRKFTEEFLGWQHQIAEDPQRVLTTTISALQSYGLKSLMLSHGVGGTFTGLFVTAQAVQWQDDLLFLLVDSSSRITDMITTGIRGNALITQSNSKRALTAFANEACCGPMDIWEREWEEEIRNFVQRSDPAFIIGLAILRPVVVICDMGKPAIDQHLQTRRHSGQGEGEVFRLEMRMSEMLIQAFDHAPEFPSDSFGTQFFWFPPPPDQ